MALVFGLTAALFGHPPLALAPVDIASITLLALALMGLATLVGGSTLFGDAALFGAAALFGDAALLRLAALFGASALLDIPPLFRVPALVRGTAPLGLAPAFGLLLFLSTALLLPKLGRTALGCFALFARARVRAALGVGALPGRRGSLALLLLAVARWSVIAARPLALLGPALALLAGFTATGVLVVALGRRFAHSGAILGIGRDGCGQAKRQQQGGENGRRMQCHGGDSLCDTPALHDEVA
ncbi:hypothetical protein [Luteimonas arsenica]|uniref:hypothetical protein n=1 Tax=Luteimonas arsenica TaxID=1586242 RepID=UPI001054B380|nr:hypothetical protein [Luteimonas arsenica]